MIIYIIVFAIALLFSAISEKYIRRNKRKFAVYASIVAILIPCLLAAVRAPGVGIDSGTYAYTDYLIALNSRSFGAYFLRSSVSEVLYGLIVYGSSRITDSFFLLFFVSQLLIVAPTYISLFLIKKKRREFSLTISYASFLFIYYNMSLSIIRECIAIAFIILEFTIYKINKKIGLINIILYICAFLTHSFALVVVPSVLLLDKIVNDKKKTLWKKIAIISVIFLAVININNLVMLIANIAPTFMAKYINTFQTQDRSGLSTGDTLMKLLLFVMCVAGAKKEKRDNELSLTNYTFIGAVGIALQFVSIVSEYLIRISYYYQFFMIVPLGVFYSIFAKDNRRWIKIATIVFVFVYWIVVYATWNWHGSMPFEFAK